MRTQQRGNITDHLDERLEHRRCRVTCIHGKEWPEGDLFEGNGGRACRECCEEWQRLEAKGFERTTQWGS